MVQRATRVVSVPSNASKSLLGRGFDRTAFLIYVNTASQTLFVGESDSVTSGTGIPVVQGTPFPFIEGIDPTQELWGIGSATIDARIYEEFATTRAEREALKARRGLYSNQEAP